MALYGDPGFCTLHIVPGAGNIVSVSMPTAIVRTYTNEGFVIAADGRKTKTQDGSVVVVSDATQKIFPVVGQAQSLAYAIAGTVQFTPKDSDEIVFDLIAEISNASQEFASRRSRNLAGYSTRLCRAVNARLAHVQKTGKPFRYPEDAVPLPGEHGRTIAHVFLEGYSGAAPARVRARFCHEDQKLLEPEIITGELAAGCPMVYGPGDVTNLLFKTEDPRFAVYRRKTLLRRDMTMSESIEIAKSYIGACCDPEALKIDEKACSGIGGRIHIATITAKNGFQWVEGFGPLAQP